MQFYVGGALCACEICEFKCNSDLCVCAVGSTGLRSHIDRNSCGVLQVQVSCKVNFN